MTSGKAQIIDGFAIAKAIRTELKERIDSFLDRFEKRPGLAVVLVGDRKDSRTYVNMKKKACEEVGIQSFSHELPASVKQEELIELIQQLNANPQVHGILVQLPLPEQIDSSLVLNQIDPRKDVDGLHVVNVGRLVLGEELVGEYPLHACTPKGCIRLLKSTGITITGKHAVVVGRSNIVGKPIAAMLLKEDATVTVCHSKSQNLMEIVRKADILIAAVGKPMIIKGEWIQEGAVVIDVGTNAVDDPSSKRGYRLVGDVEFEEAKSRASHITPVPKGVGPMTIAMLLENTFHSACNWIKYKSEKEN